MTMARIDISKIRKEHGMNQQQLAERLQINQSFLSAIERGKSPLPADKELRIKEIFGLADFSPYMIGEDSDGRATSTVNQLDEERIARMIGILHAQAHKELDREEAMEHVRGLDVSGDAHEISHALAHKEIDRFFADLRARNELLETRNMQLTERNETLNQKITDLLEEVESLRQENFRLREQLLGGKL